MRRRYPPRLPQIRLAHAHRCGWSKSLFIGVEQICWWFTATNWIGSCCGVRLGPNEIVDFSKRCLGSTPNGFPYKASVNLKKSRKLDWIFR